MKIGRKIFYEKSTGNVIIDTGERQGAVIATTIVQDISAYTALSERNRNTFDVLELPFGAYQQDFAEGTLIGINLETKEPIFAYPNPDEPSAPIVAQVPLSTQINELKSELLSTQEAVDFLLMGGV